MATKLGKVVTYHEELPLIKLLHPSIMWIFENMQHIKCFISPLAPDQWPQNINSRNPLNMCSGEVM